MQNFQNSNHESNDRSERNGDFNMSFQPQNAEQLIGFAKWLKSREHHSIIKSR